MFWEKGENDKIEKGNQWLFVFLYKLNGCKYDIIYRKWCENTSILTGWISNKWTLHAQDNNKKKYPKVRICEKHFQKLNKEKKNIEIKIDIWMGNMEMSRILCQKLIICIWAQAMLSNLKISQWNIRQEKKIAQQKYCH